MLPASMRSMKRGFTLPWLRCLPQRRESDRHPRFARGAFATWQLTVLSAGQSKIVSPETGCDVVAGVKVGVVPLPVEEGRQFVLPGASLHLSGSVVGPGRSSSRVDVDHSATSFPDLLLDALREPAVKPVVEALAHGAAPAPAPWPPVPEVLQDNHARAFCKRQINDLAGDLLRNIHVDAVD